MVKRYASKHRVFEAFLTGSEQEISGDNFNFTYKNGVLRSSKTGLPFAIKIEGHIICIRSVRDIPNITYVPSEELAYNTFKSYLKKYIKPERVKYVDPSDMLSIWRNFVFGRIKKLEDAKIYLL